MHKSVNNLIVIQKLLKEKTIEKKQPKIIAVSKTFAMSEIKPLIDFGHKDFGENKIQEAIEKWPQVKEQNKDFNYLKQVCIYAFNKYELNKFYRYNKKSLIEKKEDIEILRFLELGIKIKMFKASSASLAVDTPNDVLKVEKFQLV